MKQAALNVYVWCWNRLTIASFRHKWLRPLVVRELPSESPELTRDLLVEEKKVALADLKAGK